MTPELISYRLYRLRRLIAVAMVPPLAVLAWLWPGYGPPETWVFAAIAALPLVHVVVYPSAWVETMLVSATCVFMLCFGASIDPGLPLDDRLFRLVLLFVLGFFVFLGLVWVSSFVLFLGPERWRTLSATTLSSLDAAALKAAMTLYPGRDDGYAHCGPADEDGLFPVTLHCQGIDMAEGAEVDFGPDAVATFAEDGKTVAADFDLTCRVETDRDDIYEVVFFTPGQETPGVSRHVFEASGNGTVVRYTERAAPLPPLLWLGMYLQDYLADYLESQVEFAEGRAPRANRNFAVRQFVVDVARLFPAPSADDDGTPRIG